MEPVVAAAVGVAGVTRPRVRPLPGRADGRREPRPAHGLATGTGRARAAMSTTETGLDRIPDGAAYDVVVVGAGGAGMAAALFAAIDGLRVLLVERTEYVGGTTA